MGFRGGLDLKGLNRIEHVLLHTEPNPAKKVHSVFNVERNKVLELVDEAWLKRGKPIVDGNSEVYLVNMGKAVGTSGEKLMKLVVWPGTSRIRTAYPVK